MEIVFFLALFLALPSLLYVAGRFAGRGVWGLVLARYEKRGGSAYRATQVPVWLPGKAPLSVKLAAISSFLLGQMVIPGALAALAGLIISLEMLGRAGQAADNEAPLIYILTLSAPTGLFVAGGLLSVGLHLLRRAPDAAQRARSMGRWSVIHNLVLLAALLVTCGLRRDLWPCVTYVMISLAQAALLFVAARALDVYALAEAGENLPAPNAAEAPAPAPATSPVVVR